MTPCLGADIVSPSGIDELRYPMTRQVQRIEPFDAEHAWSRTSWWRGRRSTQLPKPPFESGDELVGVIREIDRRANAANIATNTGKISGFERVYDGSGVHDRGQAMNDAIAHRAYFTHALRQQKIRGEGVELIGIDREERSARCRDLADFGIDDRAWLCAIDRRARHAWQMLDGRRIVALVGDADESIGAAERGDDLRGRGYQAYDAHITSEWETSDRILPI